MNYLNIKMPYPMPDNYNIELEIGDYIVKDKNGELFIDTWVDNIIGFDCWELKFPFHFFQPNLDDHH